MSAAADIVSAGVRAAVPPDYDDAVFGGWMLNDTPDGRAVAVFPVGGQTETWGVGSNVPLIVRDSVRVRLRANADDPDGWLNAMGDRLRYAILDIGNFPVTTARLYFSRATFLDGIRFMWIVVRVQTASPPRLTAGRKYSFVDTDFRLIMRPRPMLPHRVPLAFAGSPFTVFEAAGSEDAVEVQRLAVEPGEVHFGGQLKFGAFGPLTNPPDDAFPDGAPQGPFPGAEPGQVLWRNTGVGVDGTNLFDATTTRDIPEAEGGGLVRLLRIVRNADDSVSFATRERFGKDLEDAGIFIGRAGGTTYAFRLTGPPRVVGGDNLYDATAPGFTSAGVAGETEWDWAFVSGETWQLTPWESQPPPGAAADVTLTATDSGGEQLFSETWRAGAAIDLMPVTVTPADGEFVLTLEVRDASPTPIGARMRYTLDVSVDGLIVHGEPTETVPTAPPAESGHDVGFDTGFGA